MTFMIGANGVEYKPTVSDFHDVINDVQLSETMKSDARILLNALGSQIQ